MKLSIDDVRTLTGCELMDIKKGMKLWPTDDLLLAACYMIARSHAIAVKSDRDPGDRSWAKQFRELYDTGKQLHFDGKD